MIDTPTAEMQPEGQISATSSYFGGFSRNTLSVQVFPFLEASFRYSVLDDFFAEDSTRRALYDRSIDLKLRVVEEGALWPSVAIGLQDFLGTGVYSGEYVVGSKRLLDGDVTLSAGIGWGRFASLNGFTNPIGEMFEEARDRDEPRSGGGDVNVGQWFRGEEIGAFGGLAWRTPIDGLTVMVEYSNDAYTREEEFSDFDQQIPVNFGAEYRPVDWASIGAYALYGSEFGVRVTLSGNIFDPPAPDEDVPAPLPLTPRPVPEAAKAEAMTVLGSVIDGTGAGPATSRFDDLPLTDVTVESHLAGVRWARARLHPGARTDCPLHIATAVDAEFGVIDVVTVETANGEPVCSVALRPEGEAAIKLTRQATVVHPTDWINDPAQPEALRTAIGADLTSMGVTLAALDLSADTARLHIENPIFSEMPRAIGRTARAAAWHLPASVETLDVVPLEAGLPVVSVTLSRSMLEDKVNRADAAHAVWSTAKVQDAPPLTG
ncbi:MAG: YjbH domain-containing protein, partial [Pseudomonadota bacterium]